MRDCRPIPSCGGWILPPTYIPLAVEPQRIPQAWTEEELRQLFWAASRCPGSYDGVSLRVWWPAFLGVMWDSGERTTAVMSLEWRHLRSDGALHVPAQIRKGQRRDMVYRLHSDTLLALAVVKAARYRGADSQIFGTGHYSKFYYKYDRLLKLAGLPTGRLNGPHKLRRSFATYIKLLGGDATAAKVMAFLWTTYGQLMDNLWTTCGQLVVTPALVLHGQRAN